MSRGLRITVAVAGGAVIASTPLVWLLGGPGPGEFTGASVQAACGVAALMWAWFQRGTEPARHMAEGTGRATASGGGTANTGVHDSSGTGGLGSSTARNTGDARADGPGSTANTGVSNG